MATEAQIAANRRNALLSTGPKSRRGKEKIRYNAMRHGLYADQLVTLGENDADFAAYTAALCAALGPRDAFETLLVRRLALIGWRTDRLAIMEAALLDETAKFEHRRRSFAGKPPVGVWPEALTPLSRHEAALDRAFQHVMMLLERHRNVTGRGRPRGVAASDGDVAEQSQFIEPTQLTGPGNEAALKANVAALPIPSRLDEAPSRSDAAG